MAILKYNILLFKENGKWCEKKMTTKKRKKKSKQSKAQEKETTDLSQNVHNLPLLGFFGVKIVEKGKSKTTKPMLLCTLYRKTIKTVSYKENWT